MTWKVGDKVFWANRLGAQQGIVTAINGQQSQPTLMVKKKGEKQASTVLQLRHALHSYAAATEAHRNLICT